MYSSFFGEDDLTEAKKQPVILHYPGAEEKPWFHRHSHEAKRWWRYFDMQSAAFRKETLHQFLTKQKKPDKPFAEKILDKTKFVLWRLGLFYAVRRRTYKLYSYLKTRLNWYKND